MKKAILLLIACLFLFGFKPLMPDEWQAVCRHRAVYAAYTAKDYGYDVRFAVGWKWGGGEKKWVYHTRAQVFNLHTGEWDWLCDDDDKIFICYAEDRRTFRVTHYVSFDDAVHGRWNKPGQVESAPTN